MNIAILGGSFDPPHLGHIWVAQQVKEMMNMNEIWLMPCGNHPFDKKLSPSIHRLAMTQCLGNEFIHVSEFEVKRLATSYTIDTLRSLSELYPQHTFSWCIGSDQLESFPKWKEWQNIISEFGLIVFPRGIHSNNLKEKVLQTLNLNTIPEKLTVLETDTAIFTNLSSTLIKERLQQDQTIEYLVPDKVREYIEKNGLYV